MRAFEVRSTWCCHDALQGKRQRRKDVQVVSKVVVVIRRPLRRLDVAARRKEMGGLFQKVQVFCSPKLHTLTFTQDRTKGRHRKVAYNRRLEPSRRVHWPSLGNNYQTSDSEPA
jgi:hypothetical protein